MLTERTAPDLPEWLHDMYPFRTRTATFGPCRMSFVDEGPAEAPPIVFLHGTPTWSFLYRHLIARMLPNRRVIAPDRIGYGLSDKPRDPSYHSIERHIEHFTLLLEELAFRDITLVLQGWGGAIGLGYAIQHPTKIARLVLCDTWVLPVANADRIKLPFAVRLSNMGQIGGFIDSVLNLSLTAAISSRLYNRPSDWIVEGYKYPFPNMGTRTAISEFSRMFVHPSATDRATMQRIYEGLKKITAPADILVGEADPLNLRLSAYLLRDALPNAHEPVFVPNASHLLPEDAPHVIADVLLSDSSSSAKKEDPAADTLFKILR